MSCGRRSCRAGGGGTVAGRQAEPPVDRAGVGEAPSAPTAPPSSRHAAATTGAGVAFASTSLQVRPPVPMRITGLGAVAATSDGAAAGRWLAAAWGSPAKAAVRRHRGHVVERREQAGEAEQGAAGHPYRLRVGRHATEWGRDHDDPAHGARGKGPCDDRCRRPRVTRRAGSADRGLVAAAARWALGVVIVLAGASPPVLRYLVFWPLDQWQVDVEVYREAGRLDPHRPARLLGDDRGAAAAAVHLPAVRRDPRHPVGPAAVRRRRLAVDGRCRSRPRRPSSGMPGGA